MCKWYDKKFEIISTRKSGLIVVFSKTNFFNKLDLDSFRKIATKIKDDLSFDRLNKNIQYLDLLIK